MDEVNLKEMTCNLAAKAYNCIENGVEVDNNIKLLKESVKLVTEMEAVEGNEEKEALELEKLKAENAKLAAEASRLLKESERIEAEKLRIEKESESAKKDKNWDRALKIAGIAVPAAGTLLTGMMTYLIFKEKMNFTSNTMKLNALLEEKGVISGINNSKTVNTLFQELIKK